MKENVILAILISGATRPHRDANTTPRFQMQLHQHLSLIKISKDVLKSHLQQLQHNVPNAIQL